MNIWWNKQAANTFKSQIQSACWYWNSLLHHFIYFLAVHIMLACRRELKAPRLLRRSKEAWWKSTSKLGVFNGGPKCSRTTVGKGTCIREPHCGVAAQLLTWNGTWCSSRPGTSTPFHQTYRPAKLEKRTKRFRMFPTRVFGRETTPSPSLPWTWTRGRSFGLTISVEWTSGISRVYLAHRNPTALPPLDLIMILARRPCCSRCMVINRENPERAMMKTGRILWWRDRKAGSCGLSIAMMGISYGMR